MANKKVEKIGKKVGSELKEEKITKERAPIDSIQLPKKKKQEKQLFWIITLMIIVVAALIFIPMIVNYITIKNSKFVYAQLDWQKTKAGDMIYYSTRLPVADQYGKVVDSFFINLRNDPRELNKTDFKLTTGIPTFNKEKTVYLSIGEMNRNCVEGSAATLTLAGFLRQFALMNVSAGMSNEKIANESNFPYITCENSRMNTVINIIEGNTTRVEQINSNCYELEYANCDVLKISERFVLEVIEGYMRGFKKGK